MLGYGRAIAISYGLRTMEVAMMPSGHVDPGAWEGGADGCVRPPYDAELEPLVGPLRELLGTMSTERLAQMRTLVAEGAPGADPVDYSLDGRVRIERVTAPSRTGPDVGLEVYRAAAPSAESLPMIYYIHGGGGLWGLPHDGVDGFLRFVAEGRAVVVSVDYRLAPENPAPAGADDAYTGLAWAAEHALDIGAAPQRIILAGISTGAGMAAGVALRARDLGFPRIGHLVMTSPMLDDRLRTGSSRMLPGEGTWSSEDGLFAWSALLGEARGSGMVSPYVAPGRATDLAGMPRTYMDVGSNEMFRDEALEFAAALSRDGVAVDLHMWGGGFHGFDTLAPTAAISRAFVTTRDDFVGRALAPDPDGA